MWELELKENDEVGDNSAEYGKQAGPAHSEEPQAGEGPLTLEALHQNVKLGTNVVLRVCEGLPEEWFIQLILEMFTCRYII